MVNAAGLWAREVGRMVGLELPVLAMEHMYLLTEDMPEVAEINANTGAEVLHAVDFDGEIYLRQERAGMLMGTYEKACKPWSETNTPWEFGHQLLEPDIDRIAPSLECQCQPYAELNFGDHDSSAVVAGRCDLASLIKYPLPPAGQLNCLAKILQPYAELSLASHFPAFEKAGIKQIINGPFTFAPAGNPLVGREMGMTNYWTACAVMAGFSQGGGVGLSLANWII